MGKQLTAKISIMEDEALRNAILKMVTDEVHRVLKTDAWSLVTHGTAVDILGKVSQKAEAKYTQQIADYVSNEVKKAISAAPLEPLVQLKVRAHVDAYLANLSPEKMDNIIKIAVKERLAGK